MCSTFRQCGPAACRSRVIHEPLLLECVVRTLRTTVLGEGFEDRLHARLKLELGKAYRPAAITRLQQEIASLDKTIDRATENLLLANPSQARRAVEKLSMWQAKRDSTAIRLEKIEAGRPLNLKRLVANAMHDVRRLQFGLIGEDPKLLHQTLQQLVARITLTFAPDPTRNGREKMSSGVIIVREPSYDAGSIERRIDFSWSDLGEFRPRGRLGWRDKPNTTLMGNGPKVCVHRLPSEVLDGPQSQSCSNWRSSIPPDLS